MSSPNHPTIVFIDDSATMREVIKIAFRRENIDVVAYSDAATALGQIEQHGPDVVITDVIMPDKDGYEVCQFIKRHPTLNQTPVILMSGVVNRSVAERAFSVKADELIRKPFQPHDLITRVKHLLTGTGAPPTAAPVNAAAALSSIFGAGATPARGASAPPQREVPVAATPRPMPIPVASVPAASLAGPRTVAVGSGVSAPAASFTQAPPAQILTAPPVASYTPSPVPAPRDPAPSGGDLQKLRLEVMRLEGLLRKVQSELQAEREYAKSLEEQLKVYQQG